MIDFKVQSTNRNFANGFRQVFITLEYLQTGTSIVQLDFSACDFINPSLLLPLVALKESSGLSTRLEINAKSFSQQTSSYLSAIHFPDAFHTDLMTEPELKIFLNNYKHKGYIPIISFPGGNSQVATQRRDLILGSIGGLISFNLQLTPEAQTAIMMLISELTDNIGDHAGVTNAFIIGQYYPGNRYLDICIADCGIGILRSFQKVNPKVTKSSQAIDGAVKGQSTKGIGRGYGISGSVNMLSAIGGEFILLSGDSSFVQRINKLGAIVDTPNSVSWPGCLVLIRVPTTMPADFSIYQYYS